MGIPPAVFISCILMSTHVSGCELMCIFKTPICNAWENVVDYIIINWIQLAPSQVTSNIGQFCQVCASESHLSRKHLDDLSSLHLGNWQHTKQNRSTRVACKQPPNRSNTSWVCHKILACPGIIKQTGSKASCFLARMSPCNSLHAKRLSCPKKNASKLDTAHPSTNGRTTGTLK